MSEVENIKEKWKNEDLSESEIENLLQTLKKVYIGQHIREGSVLQYDFKDKKQEIEKLRGDKLIKDANWYGNEKQIIGVSEPLINYATFEDYIKLIDANWDLFKNYFNSKDEAFIPLKLINILVRRPLAHFRTLTKKRIEEVRKEMKEFLEKTESG